MTLCACVRACVRACARACVRACARACVRACTFKGVCLLERIPQIQIGELYQWVKIVTAQTHRKLSTGRPEAHLHNNQLGLREL